MPSTIMLRRGAHESAPPHFASHIAKAFHFLIGARDGANRHAQGPGQIPVWRQTITRLQATRLDVGHHGIRHSAIFRAGMVFQVRNPNVLLYCHGDNVSFDGINGKTL